MKVKKLVASKGVKVDKKLDDDLKHIMQNNLAETAKKYPQNTFQRVFWEQHAQSSGCKNRRTVRWHPAMIRWCLYLRHLYGKASAHSETIHTMFQQPQATAVRLIGC